MHRNVKRTLAPYSLDIRTQTAAGSARSGWDTNDQKQNMNLEPLLKFISITAILALAGSARAEVLQYLTFNITTYSQRDINDNGTNTVAAAPKVQSHNTAESLSILARDKAAQGNWH